VMSNVGSRRLAPEAIGNTPDRMLIHAAILRSLPPHARASAHAADRVQHPGHWQDLAMSCGHVVMRQRCTHGTPNGLPVSDAKASVLRGVAKGREVCVSREGPRPPPEGWPSGEYAGHSTTKGSAAPLTISAELPARPRSIVSGMSAPIAAEIWPSRLARLTEMGSTYPEDPADGPLAVGG
jgi:hypothetical protein